MAEATGVGAFVVSVPPGLVFPPVLLETSRSLCFGTSGVRDVQPDLDGLIKTGPLVQD